MKLPTIAAFVSDPCINYANFDNAAPLGFLVCDKGRFYYHNTSKIISAAISLGLYEIFPDCLD